METFVYFCENGLLKDAQEFLKNNPNFDVTQENHEAFIKACYNTHKNIIDWFVQLNPDYMFMDCDGDEPRDEGDFYIPYVLVRNDEGEPIYYKSLHYWIDSDLFVKNNGDFIDKYNFVLSQRRNPKKI